MNDNPSIGERILGVKDFLYSQERMSPKWLSHKEIGTRIREIRESLGVSQERFAELLERPKSQGDVGKIERGALWAEQAEPNIRLLMKAAELGGVTIEHFQIGDSTDAERAEKLIAAKWMQRLANQLRAEATPVPEPVVAARRGRAASKRRPPRSKDPQRGEG